MPRFGDELRGEFGSGRFGLNVVAVIGGYGFAPITSVASRVLHVLSSAPSKPGIPVVVEMAGIEPASETSTSRFNEPFNFSARTTDH